jgi:hypothetical protein
VNARSFGRIGAIVIGAGVVYLLQHVLGYSIYIAVAAGVIAYAITRFGADYLAPKG